MNINKQLVNYPHPITAYKLEDFYKDNTFSVIMDRVFKWKTIHN